MPRDTFSDQVAIDAFRHGIRNQTAKRISVNDQLPVMSTLRRTFGFLLVAALLLVTAHELPAPISEEATPTPSAQPKPKSPARAKQKSSTVTDAEKSRRAQTGSKQSPFGQFEGTWTGTVTSTATATLLFSSTSSVALPVTIRVSKNGVVNYAAEQPVQGTLSPDGRVLGWNIQKNISEMVSRVHYSMRLIGPNTASYSDTSVIDGAIAAVSGSSTGTLRKQ